MFCDQHPALNIDGTSEFPAKHVCTKDFINWTAVEGVPYLINDIDTHQRSNK